MTTALLLIDVQRDMLDGDDPVPAAPEVRPRLEALLAGARAAGVPVVHVQNDGPPGSTDEPGTEGWELAVRPAPGDRVVRKDQGDAFAADPELASRLAAAGVDAVAVAGMQSEHCIAATSRGALGAGLAVLLVADAHATYDDGGRSAADISAEVAAELAGAGVRLVPASEVDFGPAVAG